MVNMFHAHSKIGGIAMSNEHQSKTQHIIVHKHETEGQSKTGFWASAEAPIKAMSLLLLPAVIAWGGWQIQDSLSQRDINKDYVELAVSILSKPKDEQDSDLRGWAVELINTTAPVKFNDAVKTKLTEGEVDLPQLSRTIESNFKSVKYLDDEFAKKAAQAVVLFRSGNRQACTAFFISMKHIITSNICYLEDNDHFIVLDYVSAFERNEKIRLKKAPVDLNTQLGYVIFEIEKLPKTEYSYLEPTREPIARKSDLLFIHHIENRRKSFSDNRCKITDPLRTPQSLAHNCDSGPGTSGAPLIDTKARKVVGMHSGKEKTGNDKERLGWASSIYTIFRESEFLKSSEFQDAL